MASDADDELARTATVPGGATAPAASTTPITPTLGRYKIERELGAGGMGVVHAAFDPDLERRVALKVLRNDDAVGADGRQRLLREARAMARLVHANVVTVHEVGSANGRDYVAMELVEGETLADWLRAEPRAEATILDAFLAAGRGLAAAHAAGIVHRDFKPHNVLRSKSGRIVVTDFGLAREASADPLAVTRPLQPGTPAGATGTPSTPLAGLTMTGSVLGTPAYMAPEQWSGGAVTPATDQFAYCVALWEALAGERPFRAPTVEALRDEVARGPEALDATKIPRRLRAALRRGLDPDPKRRFPSMEPLLAAIAKTQRRPASVAMVVFATAVVVAAVVYVAVGGRGAKRDGARAPIVAACPAPKLDPEKVIPPASRPLEARAIAADLERWQSERERTCAMAPDVRFPRLTCLDGVLAQLDVVAGAASTLPRSAQPFDVGRLLLDPKVCANDKRVPTLSTSFSREYRDAIETAMRETATPGPTKPEAVKDLLTRVSADACATALANLFALMSARTTVDRVRHLAEAEQSAERCDDDRVRAEVAMFGAAAALESSFLGNAISAKIKLAEAAIARVAQPDLIAELELLRMEAAKRADNLDEAIQRAEAAMKAFEARGRTEAAIRTGLTVLELRELRSTPEDLAYIKRSAVAWRARAVTELGDQHPVVAKIDRETATRELFGGGDVARAHARLEALYEPQPFPSSRKVRGRVVDERGRPVPGARVAVGMRLLGTSVSVATPIPGTNVRFATTDIDGAFEVPDAPEYGFAIAQLGDRRTRPVKLGASIELALEPTGRIEGKIDLGGEPPSKVIVALQDLRLGVDQGYELVTPVAADGTFVFEGVPRTKVRIFAALRTATTHNLAGVTVDARAPVVKNVQLALSNQQRIVHVLVRSTFGMPVDNAQVIVLPGTQKSSTTAAKLNAQLHAGVSRLARQIEGEKAPPAVVTNARPGDLFATITQVPQGAATACGLALPSDIGDAEWREKIPKNLDKLEVRCVPIAPAAEVVVVEVPPFPRLD